MCPDSFAKKPQVRSLTHTLFLVFLEIEAEFQKCAQEMSDSFAAAGCDCRRCGRDDPRTGRDPTRITSSEKLRHPSNELVTTAATSNPDFPETYGGA